MNNSGLIPTEFCVVVELDPVAEKVGSILMPSQVQDRDKLSAEEGTLIEVSPVAFDYANWPANARKPKVGERVLFRKYAGLLTNRNGRAFRLLNDKDIVAIVVPVAIGVSGEVNNLRAEAMAASGEVERV